MLREGDVDRNSDWTAHERELIERFEAAYNSIDRYLRGKWNKDGHVPFGNLLELQWPRSQRSKTREDLKSYADLRNVIVHSKTRPHLYLAAPSPWVVANIERIRDDLTSPALAIPTFQREVTILKVTDSLNDALTLIRERGFSQFPVYEGERFRGLLTEKVSFR